MLSFLPAPLRGAIALVLIIVSTLLWFTAFTIVGLPKLLLPLRAVRRAIGAALERVAEGWIATNGAILALTQRLEWALDLPAGLSPDRWYVVVSNHQSWTDIVLLQIALNRRIPPLRFFLKTQLIWVPVIGVACWMLDFPFMRRYTREQLAEHPELRFRDLDATRRACHLCRERPAALMNFIEGTRFTDEKHARQRSPHRHLLRPKAGGVALALDTLGDRLAGVLDLTVYYPNGRMTLWELLSGKARRVVIRGVLRPVPAALAEGDYRNDPEHRERVQAWVCALWEEKDAQIEAFDTAAG